MPDLSLPPKKELTIGPEDPKDFTKDPERKKFVRTMRKDMELLYAQKTGGSLPEDNLPPPKPKARKKAPPKNCAGTLKNAPESLSLVSFPPSPKRPFL